MPVAPAVLRPDEMKSACEKAGFFSERGRGTWVLSWWIEKKHGKQDGTGWYRLMARSYWTPKFEWLKA